ncbi:hypothetical protein HYV49_02650 [Candidatus Pacearchaeota archaeon]|nr:hypothetical protein [Candidatus Pacearchaeota archaeon]
MKKVIFTFILSILFLEIVYAVGGGGGGNGDGGGGGSIPVFSDVKCFDDGSIGFQMYQEQKIIAVNEATGQSFEVQGGWDNNGNFKSKEFIFNDAGRYSITNDAGVKQIFICPGFKFACSLVSIINTYCVKNASGIFAGFELINDTELVNLKFNYGLDKRIFSYEQGRFSPELRNITINQNGNKFNLAIKENFGFDSFEVVHKKCIGKRYIYSRVSCAEVLNRSDVDTQSLKCGGLLDLKDRVRCRINLESEHDEYQNFYPEECRNNANPDKCVALYQSVSECWDLGMSVKRIACLKEKIGISDVKKEKADCRDISCRKELNGKIFTMIKLRFYQLEEQAEMLMERELLDEEAVIDFVTNVELKKQEFNAVKSKDEMRQIIKDVRDLWTELMSPLRRALQTQRTGPFHRESELK